MAWLLFWNINKTPYIKSRNTHETMVELLVIRASSIHASRTHILWKSTTFGRTASPSLCSHDRLNMSAVDVAAAQETHSFL